MDALKTYISKLIMLGTLVAFMSLVVGVGFCAAQTRKRRGLENGSSIMVPGYLNIDKERTKQFKEQPVSKKTLPEKKVDKIGDDIKKSLTESTPNTGKVILKKKTGKEDPISQEQEAVQSYSNITDLNKDGVVDDADVDILKGIDMNSDGVVDGADYDVWKDNYDPLGLNGGGAGDANGDGKVDGADLALWQQNYGSTVSYEDLGSQSIQISDESTTSSLRFRKGSSDYTRMTHDYFTPTISLTMKGKTTSVGSDKLKVIFKSLLTNKDVLALDEKGEMDPALLARLLEDSLTESTLSMPVSELTPEQMEIAVMLASIINNPTVGQKEMLDILEALINQAQQLEEETGSDTKLKKASDDFTQMVATVLLAQALPDLFKDGDMRNIKGIFSDLNKEKSRILMEYQASVKAYYDSVVEELASSMVTLQIKDVLSKKLTEKELDRLPHDRIDKIIDKIRNIKYKTVKEKAILTAEAKSREEHHVYAKQQRLEEDMTLLLGSFTKRLFSVLDNAGFVKEGMEEGKPVLNIDLSAKQE